MLLDPPDQRIIAGASATLRWTNLNVDGDAAAAGGSVTVGVAKSDGTSVITAGTATTTTITGVYEVTLPAASNLTLERLVATWTDTGDGSTYTTEIDVCGGFFFTVAEARVAEPTLIVSDYPSATVLSARLVIEEECEGICDVAFVPRYRRATVNGNGTPEVYLPDNALRRIRSVRIYSDPTTFETFSTTDLAAVARDADRRIRRTDGNVFPDGVANVVVEYEHGYNRPPADLQRQAIRRLRYSLNSAKSPLPDRATSFTPTGAMGGGTFRLDMPDTYKTGIPEVDAVYSRYSKRDDSGGKRPASRSFDSDPQRDSLFHGGRR